MLCDRGSVARLRDAAKKVNVSAAVASSFAKRFGCEEFLRAATNVMSVLGAAYLFAAECSAVQFQSFAQHAVHAAELMQQTQPHSFVSMAIEVTFADGFRRAVSTAGANGLDCLG